MRHNPAKIFVLATLLFGFTTVSAQAVNCQGRRDTGTAVGAVGGGLIGNSASRGDLGGTIAGAIIGGVAGNVIGGSGCNQRPRYTYARNRHYDRYGHAFFYDRYGHRHYYR